MPWPLSHHAAVANATGGGPFDALQAHVQHTLMGAGAVAGWEHDAVLGRLDRAAAVAVAVAAVVARGRRRR